MDGVVKYHTVHMRLFRKRGSASKHPCVGCGDPAKHWSYEHNDPAEIKGEDCKGRKVVYSADLDCYVTRCVKCHNDFDKKAE